MFSNIQSTSFLNDFCDWSIMSKSTKQRPLDATDQDSWSWLKATLYRNHYIHCVPYELSSSLKPLLLQEILYFQSVHRSPFNQNFPTSFPELLFSTETDDSLALFRFPVCLYTRPIGSIRQTRPITRRVMASHQNMRICQSYPLERIASSVLDESPSDSRAFQSDIQLLAGSYLIWSRTWILCVLNLGRWESSLMDAVRYSRT